MIVLKDELTGNKIARMVEQKGTVSQDWLVEELAEEIKRWGHGIADDRCSHSIQTGNRR